MARQPRLSEEPEMETARPDDAPTAASSDSTLSSPALQQRIAQLEAENQRLLEEKRVRELEARNAELRLGAEADAEDSGRLSDSGAPSVLLAAKTIRPEKMRLYHGNSEGEHIRWFADAEIKFLLSPEYFTTDRAKILYCMQSLEGDAATQWRQHFRKEKVDDYSFNDFSRFLLDLVADPVNRRLLAYERLNSAKQQQGQKVSVFKAYLEELESHVAPLSEEFRVNSLLTKLRPELKSKILSTGSVPTTREGLLALAIMQEKNLERYPSTSRSSGKGKPLEERVSGAPTESAGGEPAGRQRGGKKRRNSKSHPEPKADPEHRDGNCYHCGKTGHWKPECPHKDDPSFTPVNSVQSKNDSTPPPPSKRGKTDE